MIYSKSGSSIWLKLIWCIWQVCFPVFYAVDWICRPRGRCSQLKTIIIWALIIYIIYLLMFLFVHLFQFFLAKVIYDSCANGISQYIYSGTKSIMNMANGITDLVTCTYNVFLCVLHMQNFTCPITNQQIKWVQCLQMVDRLCSRPLPLSPNLLEEFRQRQYLLRLPWYL